MDRPKLFLVIGLAIILVLLAALGYTLLAGSVNVPTNRETLYQVSTIDALQQGVFDGIQPVGELRHHGDFGIGTFDALDGEMIVLEGIVYQARADGSIHMAPDTLTTPFATVTYFENDFTLATDEPMNFSAFTLEMTDRLPTENMVYAVRMHGTFPSMKVRAIPVQQKPYPTLSEAAANQSVYSYTNATGSVVGCYTPVFFEGINVVGYHLHFISDDRQTGGHILDFTVPADTKVEYDITPEFTMVLPTSGDFTKVDLSQDLSEELAEIEN
jgi:acetolactate decarboxylase